MERTFEVKMEISARSGLIRLGDVLKDQFHTSESWLSSLSAKVLVFLTFSSNSYLKSGFSDLRILISVVLKLSRLFLPKESPKFSLERSFRFEHTTTSKSRISIIKTSKSGLKLQNQDFYFQKLQNLARFDWICDLIKMFSPSKLMTSVFNDPANSSETPPNFASQLSNEMFPNH